MYSLVNSNNKWKKKKNKANDLDTTRANKFQNWKLFCTYKQQLIVLVCLKDSRSCEENTEVYNKNLIRSQDSGELCFEIEKEKYKLMSNELIIGSNLQFWVVSSPVWFIIVLQQVGIKNWLLKAPHLFDSFDWYECKLYIYRNSILSTTCNYCSIN